MHVVVVGAGVIGVGSALAVQEALPEVKVTIVAEHFTPNTTGDGAAGFWSPHLVAGAPEKIAQWGRHTHDFLHRLWLQGDCPGIGLISAVCICGGPAPHDAVPFFFAELRPTPEPQVAPQSQMAPQTPAHRRCHVVTFYAEPARVLPFLMARFRARGGTTVVSRLTSLDELAGYDVIVHCSGLGARQLAGDATVRPIRGQLLRVRAPTQKTVRGERDHYLVPNDEVVVLGGTAQENDWRQEPDAADTARIKRDCCHLVAALRGAPVLGTWAGLRPYRPAGVRLEVERRTMADGRTVPVVHNYGHGGAGVSLFWGCALEAAGLVRQQEGAMHVVVVGAGVIGVGLALIV